MNGKIFNSAEGKLISPTQEEWRVLLLAAVLYRDLRPWDWVEEEDLFGVRDPWTGEIGWCVVVGSLGQMPGLVVYRGDLGYKWYTETMKRQKLDFESAIEMDILTASFSDRKELTARDIQVIKDAGLSCRGRKQWPQFRSQHPWRAPWYLAGHEARFLALALLQAIGMTTRLGKGELSRTKRGGDILVREFSGRPEILDPLFAPGSSPASGKADDGVSVSRQITDEIEGDHAGLWVDTWVKPKACEEPVPQITYDANKVRTIASRASRGGCWEVDVFPFQTVLADDTVPYWPAMLLVGDAQTGFLLHTQLTKPDNRWNVLTGSFLDFLLNYRHLPAEIRVERETLLKAWAPLCGALGIEVKKVRSLPLIRFAEREFLRRFNKQSR
ncbi:MAG TPA: hypothetical protein GX510_01195 [Firmicutes bacterium]|nr:hypothetical protein [Candidatus Fermentithermobacillaceae bacterium]